MKTAKYTKIALSFCVSALTVACVTGSSIYYDSQAEADRALAAFDKANPQCQLWTNWQKMCSRANPDGQTLCARDPAKPVEPSKPFCVASTYNHSDTSLIPANDIDTLESIERFCSSAEATEKQSNPDWTNYTAIGFCRYKSDRPFADPVVSRRNTSTKSWQIVSDGKVRNLSGQSYNSYFDVNVSSWCNEFDLLGEVTSLPVQGDGVVLPVAPKSDANPVSGIWCRLLKK